MAFDRQARAAGGASMDEVRAGGAPGRRTLTDELAAQPAAGSQRTGLVQRKNDLGGGNATGALPPMPQLDARGTAINNLLESYQRIGVQVPAGPGGTTVAHVQIPYWNNRYVKAVGGVKLDAPAGFDAGARTTALGALGIGEDEAVATGKGRPDEIGQAVAQAIQAGLVAPPAPVPVSADAYWAAAWKPVLEAWLLRVGLGLDCSGFVFQALHEVKSETGAETTATSDGDSGILDGYKKPDENRTYVTDEAIGGQTKDGYGVEVKTPGELEVGVTMYVPSHIRIIMHVDKTRLADGVVEFVTGESTADGRYRPGGATNGPRVHFWRYVGSTLYHRYEGSTAWLQSKVEPKYRRHLEPEGPVQRKADGGGATAPGAQLAAAGPGAPLPAETRRKMEASFATSFGGVRVHEDGAAQAAGAQAFADGEHLHFAPGRYQPGSDAGDALLGHELAHVVQQREGRVSAPQGKGQGEGAAIVEDAGLEAEADRMGAAAAAGRPAAGGAARGAEHAEHAEAREAPRGQAVQRKDDLGGGGGAPAATGGFDALLGAVDAILAQREAGAPAPVAALQPAVAPLVAWCRAHLPDAAQVQSYLRSSAPREAKIEIIGRLGDELARMEYMLGGLYNGAPSGTSWRTDGGSASLFVTTYLEAAGGLAATDDWCASFAGYGYGRLGADEGITDYFGSGLKQRGHGTIVFPQESWSILCHLIDFWRADPGSQAAISSVADLVRAFLDDAPAVLAQLDVTPPGKERGAFEQHLYGLGEFVLGANVKARAAPTSTPLSGDLLILNSEGPAVGTNDDHTAMIDRFAFPTMSTIEGNLGDTTGTRQLDLTNREHLGQIYFITRPAQQIVDAQPGGGAAAGEAGAGSGVGAGATGGAGAGDPGAGSAQLLSLIEHNQRLHAVFGKLSEGGAPGPYAGSAHEWER